MCTVRLIGLAVIIGGLAQSSPVAARTVHHKPRSVARKHVAPAKPVERHLVFAFPLDIRTFEGVSSPFGHRRLGGKKDYHSGLDLRAPTGSWVIAARDGRVSRTGYDNRCGYFVELVHDEGPHPIYTVYCHMVRSPAAVNVEPGRFVPLGSIIGEVGSTGHATGPHLHFGVKDDQGHYLNPAPLIMTPAETYELLKRRRLASNP